MNPRSNSGIDYRSVYRCKRSTCRNIARYGYRGLCKAHYDAERDCQLLARGRVDARPVAEHIQRLQRSGMEMHSIAHYSGVTTVTLWRVSKQLKVNADTAARVLRVRP